MTGNTLRNDVWHAAYEVTGDRDQADDIARIFADKRASRSKVALSKEKREAIEADLRAGGLSYGKLREKHGVGVSSIQRIAADLKASGTTVRTTGQTNVADALPKR